MSLPIPQPPALPFIGNATDVDSLHFATSLQHLAAKYGPIYKLNIFGRETCFISSVELLNEICDEKRFHKSTAGILDQVRNGLGDGLFTAYHGEHNWGVAHRILVPAFGPLAIKNMFDEMHDLATQLVARWARRAGERINVTDDYTRLTLDSIALCAMDKRFNSFYAENMHPFVTAMVDFLIESGRRNNKTQLELMLNMSANRKYQADIDLMKSVAQEVLEHRRANPSDKKDLLNALVLGKDPRTGEHMTDENIINNMITFLVAGHETTAGLLSLATYFLMKYPEIAYKAQAEVDSVLGKGPIRYEHISKFPYIEAILRESLRLWPTAPAFTVTPHDTTAPTILAGKYLLPAGMNITAVLPSVGRDTSAYGDDAAEFKPDRMYGENFAKLPPDVWKPFGNGERACIGRPFAWQEAIMSLALILQNLNLRFDDASYNLKIRETLTMKPEHLFMRVNLREGVDALSLERRMFAGQLDSPKTGTTDVKLETASEALKPLTVIYGSNSGTCEGLAQSLAKTAPSHGYTAQVSTMDAVVEHLASSQPLVVITASYEGQPTDNGKSFIQWLKTSPATFKGLQFAVFGCGHKDWVATYQKIPTYVDKQLETCGATRLVKLGATNVAAGTIFDDFDHWQDELLWPALTGDMKTTTATESLDIIIGSSSQSSRANHGVRDAVVISNELLTAAGVPEKRHVQIKLPDNVNYEPGDYLTVLPVNDIAVVSRVLNHFRLPWDAVMTVKQGNHSSFPTGKELSISSALATCVELNVPATQKNLATIAAFTANDETRAQLSDRPADGQTQSILELLEAHPEIDLPFNVYLAMLSPMRIRQYSVSSSPLVDPSVVSIAFTVAGMDTTHPGVASNYLRQVNEGARIQVAIKKCSASFRPPSKQKTPMIMICAGSGISPFRGFVQDRVARIQASNGAASELGEAALFVGCRSPDTDLLFKEELQEAEKHGAVKVYYAFSRAREQSVGCKYVQERLYHEREVVQRLFDQGARGYICGSSAVGDGIADAVARLRVEDENAKEKTLEEAKEWWRGLRGERYAVDVFA